MAEAPLYFSAADRKRLEPHLPTAARSRSPSHPDPESADPPPSSPSALLPFTTLTFATSLDSALALGPGIRTALSGPRSKAMTHYLRSRHDAICVGVGTAIADDPGLNSRLADLAPVAVAVAVAVADSVAGEDDDDERSGGNGNGNGNKITAHQPRPVVIDPHLRWDFTAQSKVMRLARDGKGLAPYIVTLEREPPAPKRNILEGVGGKFIILNTEHSGQGGNSSTHRLDWRVILSAVRREGLRSIMIEGGAEVINSLLGENTDLVDSVIVTIAPTWLGQGGVTVSPPRTHGADKPVARLSDTMWLPLGDDVVLCGRIAR
ncbi:dihydrofolate reductase-like domain-containing protein [Xylaria cf. heliscus]|nr:dihydrofolate reductase-like domain-containing protein [Xylaria cf. heliscus]